jgi:multimeric flavodoxin WrbA
MPKAVAINGSPRMEKGFTAMVLGAFIEGMTEAGSEVELFYASRLKVKPCSCGEVFCWGKKPGECFLKDDVQLLYPKLREADTLVLATPVYVPLPGRMQDVINRLCPLIKPRLEWYAGRTRARFRDDVQIRRIALVATGAWWERDNLDLVVRITQELAANASVLFAGAVLRPHAFVMKRKGELTEDGRAVLDAVRRAGRELATEGTMHAETLEAISRPLISEEDLRQRYNSLV